MMRKSLVLIVTLLLLCSLAQASYGSLGYGARAIGMGGAFTAVADDGSAAYWNPAGIPQVKFALTAGTGVWYTEADSPELQVDIVGMSMPGYIGLTTEALALNIFYDVYSESYYDYYGNELDNLTIGNVALTGTLAMSFWDFLLLGGNIKLLGYSVEYSIFDNYESYANQWSGSALSYDFGAILQPFGNNILRVGFMARNVNGPEMDIYQVDEYGNNYETGEVLTITPEYVVGIAIKPSKSAVLAADMQFVELNEEDHMILKAGLEQKLLWGLIALRGGIRVPDMDFELVSYCAGAGLKLGPLFAEMALDDLNHEEFTSYHVSGGIKF